MHRQPPWLELLLPSLERTCPVLHHSRPVARQRSITRISLPSSQTNCRYRGFFSCSSREGPSPACLAGLRGLQWSLLALLQLQTLPPYLPAQHLGSHSEFCWKAEAPSGHSPTWSGGKPWCDPSTRNYLTAVPPLDCTGLWDHTGVLFS